MMRAPRSSLLMVLLALLIPVAASAAESHGIDRTLNRQVGPLGDPNRLGPGGAVEFVLPGFDWPRLVLRPEVYVTDQGTLGTAAAGASNSTAASSRAGTPWSSACARRRRI